MITKTKTLISVDSQVLRDMKRICEIMGMKLSSLTEKLYMAFLESERRPSETIEQVIKKFEAEYSGQVKKSRKKKET